MIQGNNNGEGMTVVTKEIQKHAAKCDAQIMVAGIKDDLQKNQIRPLKF